MLRQSTEQVLNKVIQHKTKTDKNISAFKGSVAMNNPTESLARIRSVPLLKKEEPARKVVGFMERTEDSEI